MNANPMFRIDAIVFFFCWSCACFVGGLFVGEEQSAAKLQPCPQDGKASLIKSEISGQVCTYASIEKGGRKFKWEVRKI